MGNRPKVGTNKIQMEKVLRDLTTFEGLISEQMGSLIGDFSFVRAGKGETIFFQTEESTDLYMVFEGAVKASLLGIDGQEVILATLGKGSFFGEISFLDGKPRSATIIAEEDSILGTLKRDKFLLSVRNDPTIALGLLSALLHRIRAADEMLESFAFLDVNHRLVKLLLQAAKTKGEKGKDGFCRTKKITHKELAAKIGSSREAVSKALKFLSAKRIIQEDDGDFLIFPEAEKYLNKALSPM